MSHKETCPSCGVYASGVFLAAVRDEPCPYCGRPLNGQPTVTAPTLTEFLLARIAEDEAVAREAEWREGYGAWEYAIVNQSGRIQTVLTTGTSPQHAEHLAITHDSEALSDSVSDNAGPHIARHDPARVLAECEAKRRIVEATANEDDEEHARLYGGCGDSCQWTALEWACRALALPYADHPDYLPEWRP